MKVYRYLRTETLELYRVYLEDFATAAHMALIDHRRPTRLEDYPEAVRKTELEVGKFEPDVNFVAAYVFFPAGLTRDVVGNLVELADGLLMDSAPINYYHNIYSISVPSSDEERVKGHMMQYLQSMGYYLTDLEAAVDPASWNYFLQRLTSRATSGA
ncbi:hypothetical protein [Hydrogenibacillus sp. N12]|uniref:hypothetical protein n=1 Tax=Hydrogenibacillus sp. N12 TaxID=2866627 RepID=UPI001C7D8809|nr:hypothetical protein [Hydrogenibacillus sp. N12]QZA33629.1 hypothetical protein K2M58_03600 [Hydrogenibacillus sp. N12]